MIIVIDNYDSFTYNLVQQIERLAGTRVEVVRNDAFDVEQLLASGVGKLVISPGPGIPARAGLVVDLIRAVSRANRSIPLLGVCLGHQAIGEAFGARIVRGLLPVHGKVAEIGHERRRLFAGCDVPLRAARYHSLIIDAATLPAELEIDAQTSDGTIMAIAHTTRPLYGIQFHPESYGTTGGDRIITNFLEAA